MSNAMKIFLWISTIVGVIVVSLWGYRKAVAYANRDNARDKDEKAANVQAEAKGRQAAASYADILLPMATNVRINGALIDMNPIGGTLPALITYPAWPSYAPPG